MSWHFVLMAVLYVVAGIFHFIKPRMYIKVMPYYFKQKSLLVYLSGIAEIVLGLALFYEPLLVYSIYGIVIMLVIFFTVHINMLNDRSIAPKIPKFILILRLFLQFGLIAWALSYL